MRNKHTGSNFDDFLKEEGIYNEVNTSKKRVKALKRSFAVNMFNPPHPGGAILELCIKPLGLTITQTAVALDVNRGILSELINGHRGISTEMAERLALAFGGEAILWLNMQTHYDLWQLKHSKKKLNVQRLYKKAS